MLGFGRYEDSRCAFCLLRSLVYVYYNMIYQRLVLR